MASPKNPLKSTKNSSIEPFYLNPYEKISFALSKYDLSRFVFRFFGSLECPRLHNSFCRPRLKNQTPAPHSSRTLLRGGNLNPAEFQKSLVSVLRILPPAK